MNHFLALIFAGIVYGFCFRILSIPAGVAFQVDKGSSTGITVGCGLLLIGSICSIFPARAAFDLALRVLVKI
jgi:hypothetical protein